MGEEVIGEREPPDFSNYFKHWSHSYKRENTATQFYRAQLPLYNLLAKTSRNIVLDSVITLPACIGKRKSNGLAFILSFFPNVFFRYLNSMTHQGAARDAARIHFRPSITMMDVLILLLLYFYYYYVAFVVYLCWI